MAKSKAAAKTLDMTNVKDRKFNPKALPSGDYRAKITSVDDHEADSGNEGWVFGIKVESATFPYYCMFGEKQLWKIRNLLIAAGIKVPAKRLKVDPTVIIGKEIGVSLEDDEYEGRERSVIASVFHTRELEEGAAMNDDDDDDDDEERPVKKTKKATAKKAKRRADEDEDEDEVDDDDLEELDLEDDDDD